MSRSQRRSALSSPPACARGVFSNGLQAISRTWPACVHVAGDPDDKLNRLDAEDDVEH